MTEFAMTVGGQRVSGADTFPVENPARGVAFASAPDCSRDVLDRAMTAASSAFQSWRRDLPARRAALTACAGAIMSAADELAAILTTEQGKPLSDSLAEVQATAGWFGYFASLEIPEEVLQDDASLRVELHRRPLGVVAAITPWNYPLLLAGFKLAPALLAGNTTVLKPSPYTPLSSLLLGEVLAKVLPPGVLNVVTGLDALGPLLTQHPLTRKISFTGSTATGRLVAADAGRALKHATVELGGNDAAILLDDVSLPDVIDSVFWSAFANTGQTCIAIKRLFVHESMYDETIDLLADRAKSVVVGDGADASTRLGPLNNSRQLDIVSSMVEAARASGARIVTGGSPIDRAGYFYEPTIVADIDDNADLVALEQFGPALPVLAYRDVDDALARANATDFGLGGSVWGQDENRADEVASLLDCGTAWVNTHMSLLPHIPFSAFKTSGLGVENGLLGYHSFTELQTRHLAKTTADLGRRATA